MKLAADHPVYPHERGIAPIKPHIGAIEVEMQQHDELVLEQIRPDAFGEPVRDQFRAGLAGNADDVTLQLPGDNACAGAVAQILN